MENINPLTSESAIWHSHELINEREKVGRKKVPVNPGPHAWHSAMQSNQQYLALYIIYTADNWDHFRLKHGSQWGMVIV